MAKEFVRKILNVSTIQNLRDWTNCLGDIILKDGIYAYIRVEGEYKPISFPMIFDYNLPRKKWVHSDFYPDKDGVHGLDRLDRTTKKYDLTDGRIEEIENVADDASQNNALISGIEKTIDSNSVSYHIQTGQNYIQWLLARNSSFTGEMRIYNGQDDSYPSAITCNIAGGDINIGEQSQTIDKHINVNDRYMFTITNDISDYKITTDVSQYYASHQLTNEEDKGIIHSVNDDGSDETLSFKSAEAKVHVDNEHIQRTYSFNHGDNNIQFNFISAFNGTQFQPYFNITGSDESVKAFRDYMDKFLTITSRINDLQSQINSLSNRISALEK